MIPVLYVDDDPDFLEICSLFFERTGEIEIDTASSAPDAMEKMASGTYECIISDYLMPGMNGIQFLRELRSSGNTTPFILFTSFDDEQNIKEEAYRNGAFSVVGKDSAGKNAIHGLIRTIYWAVLYSGGLKRPVDFGPATRFGAQENNDERKQNGIDHESVRSET
ncbi:response regulator [Methanoregula sp.]|uniref:response regulator n=1 Tax=Methanoregula sp. TaxID=2052170 RepID=UPI002CC86E19|nr:response regulator [Methanoregula sp.]HVP96917.1 response regulator [Methanoregula sp.]